jgi:hypothetical protein
MADGGSSGTPPDMSGDIDLYGKGICLSVVDIARLFPQADRSMQNSSASTNPRTRTTSRRPIERYD